MFTLFLFFAIARMLVNSPRLVSGEFPQRGNFRSGGTAGVDLNGRASVRHRGCVTDSVMNDGLGNLAVFGERGDGLHGNFWRCS